MTVFDYQDFRQFLKDRIEKLRTENHKLSIREILRRIKCSSPSYYKEVIIDAKKNMSGATARRFASYLQLSADETDYFILLMQYNQSKTELEKLHFFEKLLHFRKKPITEEHTLHLGEYGYMADWENTVIRELLPLLSSFGNRNGEERTDLAQLLRMKITDRQIDDAIQLLERLKFIKKNKTGNYAKTDAAIKTDKKTPAAFRALCQFMDFGKSIINTTDPQFRLFKIAVMGMNSENYAVIENKINEVCREIVSIAGTSSSEADRLYAMNIQFYPLTRLPEEL